MLAPAGGNKVASGGSQAMLDAAFLKANKAIADCSCLNDDSRINKAPFVTVKIQQLHRIIEETMCKNIPTRNICHDPLTSRKRAIRPTLVPGLVHTGTFGVDRTVWGL